jgi:hypothetical protein
LLLNQIEAESERVHEARVQECGGFVNSEAVTEYRIIY